MPHAGLEKDMSKKAKTPPTPDYTALAHTQAGLDAQANETATRANRINQSNPWGSLTYTQTPGAFDQAGYDAAMAKYNADMEARRAPIDTGDGASLMWLRKNRNAPALVAPDRSQFEGETTWSQEVKLDPALQAQLDQMRGMSSDLMNNIDTGPIDISGAPEMGEAGFGAVQAVQDQLRQLMQPDLDRSRAAKEAALIAQGVGGNTGGEIWDRTQQQIGRNENDAYLQALMPAMQEYGNIYNRQMGNRNQWLGEQQYLREQPFNEMMTMLRGQESIGMPQFTPVPQQAGANAADVLGAAQQQYGAAMDKANANAANKSSMLGTVGTIAGTIFSDARLKSNIERVGTHPIGIGIYEYDIFGERQRGVMAQELLKIMPEAVSVHDSGFYQVDYSKLQGDQNGNI